MNEILVQNVTKHYKDVTALDNVSLRFERGKIYGLLGRNGAGKSTLMNIISNRIFADSGTVTIDGENARENEAVREKLFCVSEADLYTKEMKVCAHFREMGRFYTRFDIQKAMDCSRKFGLDTGKRLKSLSTGYRSIFKLIAALCLNVPYTIFDEPVLGLDAAHRELFYKLLLEEFENGDRTFIVATHLIEEISGLVEDVVLIDKGKVILSETGEALAERGYSVSGPAAAVDEFCAGKDVIGEDILGGLKVKYIFGERQSVPSGSGLQITPLNLQKLFVKLTEKGENEDE